VDNLSPFFTEKKKKEKDFALANQKGRIRKSSGER